MLDMHILSHVRSERPIFSQLNELDHAMIRFHDSVGSLEDHDAGIASIANSSQGLSELAIGEFRGINHEI